MVNDTAKTATETEVLEWIHSRMTDGQVSRSYKDIADGTGFSKRTVKNAVEKLESEGLLEVDRTARPFRYEKTRPGKAVLEYREKREGVSGEQVNEVGAGRTVPSVNLHDFAVELPLSDEALVMRENRETVLGSFEELAYDEESGEFYGDRDRFHFRISGDKVVVYVQGEYSGKGLSATYVKNEALRDVERCRKFLEDELNLRFEDSAVVEGRVISQDIAIEDHPLLQLADLHGVDVTPEKFHSTDSDGNVRVKLDMSGGKFGEAEASMRGKFSSDARLEESDVQKLTDDLFRMANNRSDWNAMWSYGEDREAIFRALSYLLGESVDEFLDSSESGVESDASVENKAELRESREGARVGEGEKGGNESFGERLAAETTVTSRWIDNHGNLMGYVEELEKPVKLKGKGELP